MMIINDNDNNDNNDINDDKDNNDNCKYWKKSVTSWPDQRFDINDTKIALLISKAIDLVILIIIVNLQFPS
jgi:hypothetical protein